jgi:hypothetical protein
VIMEACGGAHHWARMLTGLGHSVKLIAPEVVKPFVKKGKKSDAADAAAICEAASRPDVKFVPAKSVEQQASWPCMRLGLWSNNRLCWATPCGALGVELLHPNPN